MNSYFERVVKNNKFSESILTNYITYQSYRYYKISMAFLDYSISNHGMYQYSNIIRIFYEIFAEVVTKKSRKHKANVLW